MNHYFRRRKGLLKYNYLFSWRNKYLQDKSYQNHKQFYPNGKFRQPASLSQRSFFKPPETRNGLVPWMDYLRKELLSDRPENRIKKIDATFHYFEYCFLLIEQGFLPDPHEAGAAKNHPAFSPYPGAGRVYGGKIKFQYCP
jgi:hypothetical protein